MSETDITNYDGMDRHKYTQVLSDLYNTPGTKVWVSVSHGGGGLTLKQGDDSIVLPRDAFARFADEVFDVIDEESTDDS